MLDLHSLMVERTSEGVCAILVSDTIRFTSKANLWLRQPKCRISIARAIDLLTAQLSAICRVAQLFMLMP